MFTDAQPITRSLPVSDPPHRRSRFRTFCRRATLLAAFMLIAPVHAQAQESGKETPPSEPGVSSTHEPLLGPRLRAARAGGRIDIDGELGDAGWEGAARATGFTETWPGDLVAPPVRTVVWVAYDQTHLYLAFQAFDDPGSIRASVRDRDDIWRDDFVGVMLDTYGNGDWGYHLAANPLGVQGDTRLGTDGNGNVAFDIVYTSRGRITEDGYQVEFAIPFSSLRFPSGPEQRWRINFFRRHPRDRARDIYWAALDRGISCALCQFGILTHIEGAQPGGRLELFPSGLLSQTSGPAGPAGGLTSTGLQVDGSMGARYAFSSGLTLEGAVNPDFSQVESDAAQVDLNTTFALFFPERRPFFQEGSNLLESRISAIYTRSINDPQVAAKVVRRSGATSISYLGARDERSPLLLPFEERSFVGEAGPGVSNILRVRHATGAGSWLGALVTDRRLEGPGGSGTTFGVDGFYRLAPSTWVEWQVLGSRTVEPEDTTLTRGVNDLMFDRGDHTAAFDGERFGGHGTFFALLRDGRHWNFDVRYESRSPGFRTDNGFETRNDYRRLYMRQEFAIFPRGTFVDRIGPGIDLARTWNFAGVRKLDVVNPYVQLDLAGQTFLAGGVFWRPERFRSVDFDDVTSWQVVFQRVFGEALTLGADVWGGRDVARSLPEPVLARGLHATMSATIQPFGRLTMEPRLTFSRLERSSDGEEIFSGSIARVRTQVQFTRRAFLRLVTQYDEFDGRLTLEPLLTYRFDPFTFFFVGASYAFEDGMPGATSAPDAPGGRRLRSRQIFAKFQYLLRL